MAVLNRKTGKAEYSEDRIIRDAMILLDNEHGTMKMKFGRSHKLVRAIARALGEIYYSDPYWFTEELSLDLSGLKDPSFGQELPGNHPFRTLTVTELTFEARNQGAKFQISHADGVWPVFFQAYQLQPDEIVPVSAKLSLEFNLGGRPKVVKLQTPNRTSLDETLKDSLAEALLRDLGVILGGPRTEENKLVETLFSESAS